jgi:hypothetical protein
MFWLLQPITEVKITRYGREENHLENPDDGTEKNHIENPDDVTERHHMENPDDGTERHHMENPDDGTASGRGSPARAAVAQHPGEAAWPGRRRRPRERGGGGAVARGDWGGRCYGRWSESPPGAARRRRGGARGRAALQCARGGGLHDSPRWSGRSIRARQPGPSAVAMAVVAAAASPGARRWLRGGTRGGAAPARAQHSGEAARPGRACVACPGAAPGRCSPARRSCPGGAGRGFCVPAAADCCASPQPNPRRRRMEMRTVLLAVADAVHALASGAAVRAEVLVGVDLCMGERSQKQQKGIEAGSD